MIIECPNCMAKFNLPDAMWKEGAKARCSQCKHVFIMAEPGEASDSPAPARGLFDEDDAFAEAVAGLEAEGEAASVRGVEGPARSTESAAEPAADSEIEPGSAPGGELASEPAFPEPRRMHEARADSFEQALAEEGALTEEEFLQSGDADSGGGQASRPLRFGVKPKSDAGKKNPQRLFAVLALVATVIVGGFFLLPKPILHNVLPFLGPKEDASRKAPAKPEGLSAEQVKNLVLQNIRQYYVKNSKIGQVFVIEGEVVNKFPTPKELIKIEANLFDKSGISVVGKSLLCGNKVSLFQLQESSESELDTIINNKVGILTTNTNVLTGGEVPFVVVFPNPPDTVHEFGVKVIEAKDPPK